MLVWVCARVTDANWVNVSCFLRNMRQIANNIIMCLFVALSSFLAQNKHGRFCFPSSSPTRKSNRTRKAPAPWGGGNKTNPGPPLPVI